MNNTIKYQIVTEFSQKETDLPNVYENSFPTREAAEKQFDLWLLTPEADLIAMRLESFTDDPETDDFTTIREWKR